MRWVCSMKRKLNQYSPSTLLPFRKFCVPSLASRAFHFRIKNFSGPKKGRKNKETKKIQKIKILKISHKVKFNDRKKWTNWSSVWKQVRKFNWQLKGQEISRMWQLTAAVSRSSADLAAAKSCSLLFNDCLKRSFSALRKKFHR